jgi:protein-S-isoprenylcysteine O-methyltransferase Ste14
MVWPRYIAYFVGISLLTWLLTQLEISFPGSLKLHVIMNPSDQFGTSEFSPIEIIQPIILAACGLLMLWVVEYCPSQRPIAIPFGGLALAFMIRELDYFFDRYLLDNLWQVLVGIAAAFVIVYTYRARKRLKIAWARIWPSPGLALLFAGAVIMFSFVRLVGHEPLWMSLLGDDYRRVVKIAVEEFIELLGYFLWFIGSIEYTYQARAIAFKEPVPLAKRLREQRRRLKSGKF